MKKTLCILLAALMLPALAACGRSGGQDTPPAGTAAPVSPSDIEVLPATPTPEPQPVSELSLCGIPVVSGGQPTGIGYKGAAYQDGILTLDGVDMLTDSGTVTAIFFIGDLEIRVKGENSVAASNGTTAIRGADGEDGTVSNLVISGDGSLTVTADAAFGLSCSGSVTVGGVALLDVTGSETAVGVGGELTVGEGLAVTEDTGTHFVIAPQS